MDKTGIFVATIFRTVLPRAATENRIDAVFDGKGKHIRTVRPVDEIADFKSGAELFLVIIWKTYSLCLRNGKNLAL